MIFPLSITGQSEAGGDANTHHQISWSQNCEGSLARLAYFTATRSDWGHSLRNASILPVRGKGYDDRPEISPEREHSTCMDRPCKFSSALTYQVVCYLERVCAFRKVCIDWTSQAKYRSINFPIFLFVVLCCWERIYNSSGSLPFWYSVVCSFVARCRFPPSLYQKKRCLWPASQYPR